MYGGTRTRNRPRRAEWIRATTLLASAATFALGSVGCSGGGDDVLAGTPADVAGVWVIEATNMPAALLRDCTGDLKALEGFSMSGIASHTTCKDFVPPVVTQSGTSFNLEVVVYSCDGESATSTGGKGTVNGNALSGHLSTTSTDNWSAIEYFRGTVSGRSLSLSSDRVVYSGGVVGECRIDPPLQYSGRIE